MLLQSFCSLKNAWGKGGPAQLCAFRHSSAYKTDSQRGIRQPAERWVVAIGVNGLKRHNTVWNLGSNHKSFPSIEMLKVYGGKRRWYKTDWAGCCLSGFFRTAVLSCFPLHFAPSQRFQSTGRWWSQPRGFPYPSQSPPGSQPLQTALLYRGHQRQQLWGCTYKSRALLSTYICVLENSILHVSKQKQWLFARVVFTCWAHAPLKSLCVPSSPSAVLLAALPPAVHNVKHATFISGNVDIQ